MEIKSMQAREICSIIRECAKSGVSELRLGDMQISFTGGSVTLPIATVQKGDSGTSHSDVSHGSDTPEQLELEVEGFSEDVRRELDYTQMMIDSPADFEQSVMDSYLENEHMEEEGSHEAYGRQRSERDISHI